MHSVIPLPDSTSYDELNFCLTDTNLAKGRQAYQSSTLLDDSGFLWNASLAVDGNNNQISPNESMTCSATAGTEVPWWYVDMDRITVIDSVIVYGRQGKFT